MWVAVGCLKLIVTLLFPNCSGCGDDSTDGPHPQVCLTAYWNDICEADGLASPEIGRREEMMRWHGLSVGGVKADMAAMRVNALDVGSAICVKRHCFGFDFPASLA